MRTGRRSAAASAATTARPARRQLRLRWGGPGGPARASSAARQTRGRPRRDCGLGLVWGQEAAIIKRELRHGREAGLAAAAAAESVAAAPAAKSVATAFAGAAGNAREASNKAQ